MLLILKELYYEKIWTQAWSVDPNVLYSFSRTRDIGHWANAGILSPEDEASLSVVFLHFFQQLAIIIYKKLS